MEPAPAADKHIGHDVRRVVLTFGEIPGKNGSMSLIPQRELPRPKDVGESAASSRATARTEMARKPTRDDDLPTWRIIAIAKKGRYLGTVQAADEESAIKSPSRLSASPIPSGSGD